MAAPIFMGGVAMAWARAIGEFGATILFAGNLPGRTQTLPLAIYLGFETDLSQATGFALLLLIVAAVVLLASRFAVCRHFLANSLPGD
jgi:molybdate transport system permease protein